MVMFIKYKRVHVYDIYISFVEKSEKQSPGKRQNTSVEELSENVGLM